MEKNNYQADPNQVQKPENTMLVLRSRRIQNFKSQFKSVLLEGYEIFGEAIVDDVIDQCREIFKEYKSLTSTESE